MGREFGRALSFRPFERLSATQATWAPACTCLHLPALHSRSLFENIQLEFMIVYRFLFTVFIVFGICFWDIKKMYSLSFLNLWGNGMNNCIYNHINPFTPDPPVTARADPRPCCRFWRHQFWWSRTTLSVDLGRVRSFKPYQNEHNSIKDTGEKGKKHM